MAIEHGEVTSKDGNPQHFQTCFSQVIDENNSNQTLTEWRAEVAAALANAGSGGGTTYTAGDGISISQQNAISVDGDWLDAKGYATSSELTSATSGLATSSALESAVSTLNDKDSEIEGKVVTSASYDATTGTLTLSGTNGTIATVTVPSTGTVLQSTELKDGGSLELTWKLADESTTTTTIDLSALIDEYTSGTGITVEGNVVNVNTTWLAEQISTRITEATSSLVTTSAMESAISTATNGLASTDDVTSAITAATADLVSQSDLESATADVGKYYLSLYFDENTTDRHIVVPAGVSNVQLVSIEADGSGTTDLSIVMDFDIESSSPLTLTTEAASCSAYVGKAVAFTVSGTTDQTKIAAMVLFS